MGTATAINRNSCMLHGAVQTVKSIEGAVPIIHSTSGCGVQQYLGVSSLSGNNGSGYTGGLGVPSTNFLERQVVFGGTSRLREQLKNTVKIKKGDFYVVLTGCTPELVGDDVPAMTKELQEQFYKAIHVSTPGFKGSVHQGYTAVITGILSQFDKISDFQAGKETHLVNILGIIPEQDVYWRGNLQGIKRSLAGIGIEANVLFGPGANVQEWSRIFSAGLNLSFSAHSLEICTWLEEKKGIPYIHFDGYPIGAEQTAELLYSVASHLKVEEEATQQWIVINKEREHYYILQFLDAYYRYGFQRKFALVGDSGTVTGIARFLSSPLGLLPERIIITDALSRATQTAILVNLTQVLGDTGVGIEFESDSTIIEERLRNSDIELLLGSSIEGRFAQRQGIAFLPVSFPVADRMVLNKGYAGFEGALTLLEDLGNSMIVTA